ncbi:MAG: hypothetical protein SLAVMIC_00327 [uncultured marine phage]|uniref:Uncharacterized protein n=1 Tax=uncultured marine phage TaxID=707152 RepID=A0A8D9FQZ5_9VIRU|nr:MAG: hypothetical protein SLAVMIC_00327 [uncultured marine phage]
MEEFSKDKKIRIYKKALRTLKFRAFLYRVCRKFYTRHYFCLCFIIEDGVSIKDNIPEFYNNRPSKNIDQYGYWWLGREYKPRIEYLREMIKIVKGNNI